MVQPEKSANEMLLNRSLPLQTNCTLNVGTPCLKCLWQLKAAKGGAQNTVIHFFIFVAILSVLVYIKTCHSALRNDLILQIKKSQWLQLIHK